MTNNIHLLGISGSLRKASCNTALLHTIIDELLPEDTDMKMFCLENIPLYNPDLDKPEAISRPIEVQLFRKALEKTEGLVICSPEYNYGIPGLLKNAIDWASSGDDSPLMQKPVAVIGVTVDTWGAVHMQSSFLSIFQYLDMKPVYKPEVLITQAKNKFRDGKFSDSTGRKLIRQQLEALKDIVLLERAVKEISV